MLNMGSVKKGAYQALRSCLNLCKDERLLIISDLDTLEIGSEFLKEAKKITSDVKFLLLEDFGSRPLKTLPERLLNEVYKTDVGLYAATGKIGELQGFRMKLVTGKTIFQTFF